MIPDFLISAQVWHPDFSNHGRGHQSNLWYFFRDPVPRLQHPRESGLTWVPQAYFSQCGYPKQYFPLAWGWLHRPWSGWWKLGSYMVMPQSCALVLGIYGSDTNADYWNHSTPLQQKKCIIATQSTSTWPMDCWLVGCGGDEGFQLAHERSALRYMSLHYTPLHHVWLMTLCDFLLDLHATYIRIPACKKHSTISNTLLLLLFANAMGFHCMNLIWFDAMTASTHAKQSVVVEAFILQVSCSAPLESWSFFNSGQDSSPTVSWSNVVVSEGTHEFAHRPVWKEENAAPDLQKSWFALKVLKS